MATVRARALLLGVLLVLALCLTASAAERQPTNRYISYAGLPRTGGRKATGAPRGSGHSVLERCKDCHGQPKTAAVESESKGTVDSTGHAAATARMTATKKAAAAMTGAKKAAAGPDGAYIAPAALSEEKRRYISYAALKHDKPSDKRCPLPLHACP